MPTPREKFQALLKKLFQFDCAELDFGIYRIMNQKRAVVEGFIEEDLLAGVAQALGTGAVKDETELRSQCDELTEKIHAEFDDEDEGTSALDAEGRLAPQFHKTKLGKKYLDVQTRLRGARSAPELESEIFNHLCTFFSRYYDEGDFMSLRRYSKRDKYAIPYNGEEVHLHWANADQYYVKTGENFTDYSYRHGGWTVHFKLRNADVEQNNVKGAKRFFAPRVADVAVEAAKRTLTVPFEYRPLTPDEDARFTGNGLQEKILKEASPGIVETAKAEANALAALVHEKRRDADGNPVSLLDHHLRTYARKNSSDFFIHKDLRGFLERELDFYLKNEVLNLDELEAGGEARAASWFQMLRAIKGIGRKIIAFVAQVEDFQKRIFEKKKFVTEVHYCVTLDRVPEALYPEIIRNKAQIKEWKKLFHIHEIEGDLATPGFKEPLKVDFLKAHPHLVLDTRHFPSRFEDDLLSSIEFLSGTRSIEAALNGLVVKGENFQAMSLLRERYSQQVKCIYIDPPYNTGNDDFVYKDSYQHASWLAMASDRMVLGWNLLSDSGVLFASIDDGELPRLRILMDEIFGAGNKLGTVVWKGATDNNPTRIVIEHEFVLSFAKDANALPGVWENRSDETKKLMLEKYDELKTHFGIPDKIQAAFREWIRENKDALQPLTHYDRVDKDGAYTGSRKVHNPGKEGYRYDVLHPKTGKPCKQPARGYRFPESTMKKLLAEDRILFGEDHTQIIQIKEYLTDYTGSFKGLIELDSRTGANALEALFGSRELFRNPKPVEFVSHFLEFTTGAGDLVCDFVAGSGTTAQALIRLGQKDGKTRKYLLIEMGEHFDTILKPRIQKVIYSDEWKDGKPVSRQGSSHAFKYLRLESYEDALDNIAFQPAEGDAGQPLLALEDYVLSYMLEFSTRESETLLNVAKLDTPFDYTLRRHGKDEPQPVDLPETFNYLIGLHVESRRAVHNKGTRYLTYRGRVAGRTTVILWRTTKGWTEKEFEADRAFIAKEKLTEGAEDIFVNTDSFIEGAQSLDPVFKNLMFNAE